MAPKRLLKYYMHRFIVYEARTAIAEMLNNAIALEHETGPKKIQ